MDISLSITFEGKTFQSRFQTASIVIGRSGGTDPVDLDLSNDIRVSRRHARISWENERFWIEDLGSRHGTELNGREIKGTGKHPFEVADAILVGDTTIRFDPVAAEATQSCSTTTSAGIHDPKRSGNDSDGGQTGTEGLLEALCKLPMRLAVEAKIDHVCQVTVDTVAELISGVQRCALLLKDPGRGNLSLQAFVPNKGQQPSVSEHLANRALSTGKGFIWPDTTDEHVAKYHPVGSGMYAPLTWDNKPIGVICAENATRRNPFSLFDLRRMEVVAQYAGMAIAQNRARLALTRQIEFTNRLFSSRFPPSVREDLMRQAADDSLPVGTRRSLVTVLNSDIRQFTKLSEELGPRRMGDLLNEYFPPLIEAIFAFGGTVERFVGDGIFAVFGTPGPDDAQQERAVRAALEMQRTVNELNEIRERRRSQTSRVGIGIGIGIDCGEVLNGFIGNAERLEFAVVGDAANYASRYCSGAEAGEVLISRNVHSLVWKLVDSESREIIGKHELNLTAYVVKGLSNDTISIHPKG